jgi:YVTN family beta-propeller protein
MQMLFAARLFARPLAVAALLLSLFALPAMQAQYKVVDQWKTGGEGGWDYLAADSAAHRLYVTRGARVDVIDTTTGKLAGSIGNLQGTHGVALASDGKLGYISDGRANNVVVFDRATLATVATIAAGQNPDGIIFEPFTQTVWAFNGRSKDATVIDTATQKVVATIPLPGKPEFPAADGKGTVFVNIEDKNEIVRLDAKAHTATATWPLTGCDSPSGLAIDAAGGRLFSVCDGKKMIVTDAKTGASLATPDIGEGPDAAAYSDKLKLAFASCGEGVLSVVDAGYKTIQTLTTQKSARTMAYDPATDRIYLAAAEFGPRPDPTPENPRPRPSLVPGSLKIIFVGR